MLAVTAGTCRIQSRGHTHSFSTPSLMCSQTLAGTKTSQNGPFLHNSASKRLPQLQTMEWFGWEGVLQLTQSHPFHGQGPFPSPDPFKLALNTPRMGQGLALEQI